MSARQVNGTPDGAVRRAISIFVAAGLLFTTLLAGTSTWAAPSGTRVTATTPQPAPEAGAWGLSFKRPTLSLSTKTATHIQLYVANPGTQIKSKFKLQFLNAAGAPVASVRVGARLPAGFSTATLKIPRAVASNAKSAGATAITASLSVQRGPVATADASLSAFEDLNIAPTATPEEGSAPLTVAFEANASGGTEPYTYDWDFGDGSAHDATANPTHVFSTPGEYEVTLRVQDSAGEEEEDDVEVVVSGAGDLTATATGTPLSGTAPLTVAFTGSATGGTPPYTYQWDFGDGSSSTDQNPSHIFTSPGVYDVELEVTDSTEDDAEAHSVIVTVNP